MWTAAWPSIFRVPTLIAFFYGAGRSCRCDHWAVGFAHSVSKFLPALSNRHPLHLDATSFERILHLTRGVNLIRRPLLRSRPPKCPSTFEMTHTRGKDLQDGDHTAWHDPFEACIGTSGEDCHTTGATSKTASTIAPSPEQFAYFSSIYCQH